MDEPILLAIIGIAVIATAAGLAPRVNIAGPLLLVMAGLGVSLLPFVPAVEVDPEIILVGILPPLLYSLRLSEITLAFYLEQKGPLGYIPQVTSVYRKHDFGVWHGKTPKKNSATVSKYGYWRC